MSADPADLKITIDPPGSPTEVFLMLVKPKNEPKQYTISEVGGPSALRTSEEARYSDYPPEVEAVASQRDWRGGLGQRWQPEDGPAGFSSAAGGWIVVEGKTNAGP